MKGEKTTKGNPYKLTRSQHVIPKKSIKRFTNSDGKVLINLIEPSKKFPAKPGNDAFCVDRVWDQRSEEGWMRNIENRYQNVASLCASELQLKLTSSQHEIVSRMYLLIYLRIKFSINSLDDFQFNGHETEFSPSKADIELLESRHITAMDSNSKINSRNVTGNVMQMKVDQEYATHFQNSEWEIVKSDEDEYIFSDGYNGYGVLPINPNLCFIAKNDIIHEPNLKDARFVNQLGITHASFLYFEKYT